MELPGVNCVERADCTDARDGHCAKANEANAASSQRSAMLSESCVTVTGDGSWHGSWSQEDLYMRRSYGGRRFRQERPSIVDA